MQIFTIGEIFFPVGIIGAVDMKKISGIAKILLNYL